MRGLAAAVGLVAQALAWSGPDAREHHRDTVAKLIATVLPDQITSDNQQSTLSLYASCDEPACLE